MRSISCFDGFFFSSLSDPKLSLHCTFFKLAKSPPIFLVVFLLLHVALTPSTNYLCWSLVILFSFRSSSAFPISSFSLSGSHGIMMSKMFSLPSRRLGCRVGSLRWLLWWSLCFPTYLTLNLVCLIPLVVICFLLTSMKVFSVLWPSSPSLFIASNYSLVISSPECFFLSSSPSLSLIFLRSSTEFYEYRSYG